jgi:hypothetical protein
MAAGVGRSFIVMASMNRQQRCVVRLDEDRPIHPAVTTKAGARTLVTQETGRLMITIYSAGVFTGHFRRAPKSCRIPDLVLQSHNLIGLIVRKRSTADHR